jgi:hypothetical protein
MWAKDAEGPGANASLSTMPTIKSSSEYILKFDCLSLSGLSAQIYIGHIDGLNSAPPDMTQLSDAEIIAGFPQWSSVMEVREHYTLIP